MKASTLLLIILCGVLAIPALLFMRACTSATHLADRAVTVATQELDPRTLLNRYMWFKDAATMLDKKRADIALYEQRLADIKITDTSPRYVYEQRMQWQTEMLGVKASYNSLAAEYNAAMAKINWCFTNAGSLPAGATEPLPREFRSYESR
jgi:phage gp36-like protein